MMDTAMGVLAAIFVFGLILMGIGLAMDSEYEQERAAFVERCLSKGGVALDGYRRHGGWIGCFKVEEIYNEVD